LLNISNTIVKKRAIQFGFAILIVVVCTIIGLPLREKIATISLTMIYLTGVVIAASRLGIGPSIAASILSVLTFNFYFTKPYHSFEFYDDSYYFTFGVMLVTSIIVGSMTARLAKLVESSRQSETEARHLLEFAKGLSALKTKEEMLKYASEYIGNGFAAIVTQNRNGAKGTNTLELILQSNRTVLASLFSKPIDPNRTFSKSEIMLHQTYASILTGSLTRILATDEASNHKIEIENERLRNILLSSLSHDLRTPLTIMNGTISNLFKYRKSLPREGVNELTSLWRQFERLQKFVSNLLRMALITSGNLKLNYEAYTIQEIIGAAIQKMQPSLSKRKILNTVLGKIPLVKVDGALIEQVVANLLDNAINHTTENGVIKIEVGQSETSVWVAIEDDGPGITKGHETLMFEKFETSNHGSDRQTSGTGLGLAICKGIIQAHGGSISASNNTQSGKGAKFQFTIPIGKNNL